MLAYCPDGQNFQLVIAEKSDRSPTLSFVSGQKKGITYGIKKLYMTHAV